MSLTLNNMHSFSVSVLRFGRGWIARRPADPVPERPLELYEFEACPFCRKVREVLSELDLTYISRTCPRGANTRDGLIDRAGKAQFPYLIDPNTSTEMYESEDIISYLATTYSSGRRPAARLVSPLNTFTAALASAVRRRGRRVRAGCDSRRQPDQLLELYSFEASPYCRKVRETLHELNLHHLVHNVAKRSPRRPDLIARGGTMMVPYLIDPNTGTEMYESDDIVAYLNATYGIAPA